MIDASMIRTYRRDPMAFFGSLMIPTASGKQRWGEIWSDFQRDWLRSISESLVAVEARRVPRRSRFFLEATKGCAKTTMLAAAVLHALAFSSEPLQAETGAKDREQASELLDAAEDILRNNEYLRERVEAQSWSLLNRATGARADILSSDHAGAHGSRPWLCCIDELTHHDDERFASTLLDNLAKQPWGLALIATNSGLIGSWQHKWREEFRVDPRWDHVAVHERAPQMTVEAFEEARKRGPASRFNRLFLGDWVSDLGDAVVSDEDLQAALTLDGPPPGGPCVAGLDLSYRKDHCALVVLKQDHVRKRVQLVYAREWSPIAGRDIDLTSVQEACRQIKAFGVNTIYGDEYKAVLLSQQLQQDGLRFEGVPQSGKAASVRAMALHDAFKNQIIDLWNCQPLLRDLGKMRIVEAGSGMRLEGPRDEYGHCDLGFSFSFCLSPSVAALQAGNWNYKIDRPLVPEFQFSEPRQPSRRLSELDQLLWRGEFPDSANEVNEEFQWGQ